MFDFKQLLDAHKEGREISVTIVNGRKLFYGKERIAVSENGKTIGSWTMTELRSAPQDVMFEVMYCVYSGKAEKQKRFTEYIESCTLEWFPNFVGIIATVKNRWTQEERRIEMPIDYPEDVSEADVDTQNYEEYFGPSREQQAIVLQLHCDEYDYDGQLDLIDGELRFDGWNKYNEEGEVA